MKFSEHFGLGKIQGELDFVDVKLDQDVRLFIDPFALSLRADSWSEECHHIIVTFFERIVTDIRAGENDSALEALRFLREPNETRLGMSSGKPKGAGIGDGQARQLLQALSASTAVKTGFISSLQECELMIGGVGPDKISDLTTNVLREKLAQYTKEQCDLFSIATQQAALPPYYDVNDHTWKSKYFALPVVTDGPVLLVPKLIARYEPSYSHVNYYNDFIVNYLVREAYNSSSGLVRVLKGGRRHVYKKDVKDSFPCTKENIYRFSHEHPEILKEYRSALISKEKEGQFYTVSEGDESSLAAALISVLTAIPVGGTDASKYHSLMTSIVEFLFYPHLGNPKKEQEIHQGRKRIDIAMNNTALNGIFYVLHAVRQIKCQYVFFECKNYRNDIVNPELDQMAGRFSPYRGQFGAICCRSFEDRLKFVERCRDTYRDGRGLIIAFDDEITIRLLSFVANRKRSEVQTEVSKLIDEVCLS